MSAVTVSNALDLQQAVLDGHDTINIGSSFDLSALPGGGTQTGSSGASITRIADTSSFVFSKGLNLTHNKSVLGKGGGAYVLGQFITAEVEVHYNSAAVCGGGVCVE